MQSSKKEANHNLFHVRIPLTEKKDNSSDKQSEGQRKKSVGRNPEWHGFRLYW